MAEPLTPRQREILGVITRAKESTGREPTLTAIGEASGGISPPSVFKHILALEEKGYIRRHPNRRPPIELLTALPSGGAERATARVPLVGSLEAGRLLDLSADPQESIDVERSLLSDRADAVALRVRGFGLGGEGLLDGDHLLVGPGEGLPGATVVALLDGTGATVRRFVPEGGVTRLESARPGGETIAARHVEIYGVVLAAIRRYP